MTTIIGRAFPEAIRLSRMKFIPPLRRPTTLIFAGAVLEVKDRVPDLICLVARRRIDERPPQLALV